MASICRTRPMLCRFLYALAGWLACVALALAASAGHSQTTDELPAALPSAPEPQFELASQFSEAGSAQPLFNGQRGSVGRPPDNPSPVVSAAPEAPIVTMAPHPEDSRYWLSGQANIIFQGDLPFHSPYQGTNSFSQRGRVQDLAAGHALHRAPAHAFHPLQHRPDPRPGECRRARPEPGAGAGRLHQSGRGAQSQPGPRSLSGPLPDSPGHRPDAGDRQPGAGPFCAWPPACRCAASSSASAR